MQPPSYWIPTPTPGRLAIVPRPRGGDWLADEAAAWRRAGFGAVVSLLTPDEATDLGLAGEAAACRAAGIEFLALPVPDRGVPASRTAVAEVAGRVAGLLADGKGVALHCRQGIGRSAVLAACVLVGLGVSVEEAFRAIAAARGCPVPETPEQRRWVSDFAAAFLVHGSPGRDG